jgi:hypothetical protein
MKLQRHPQHASRAPEQLIPWYRQFWPWFIIALPAAAVIASFVSLWLAVTHPDPLVVTEDEYRQLKSELKAQPTLKEQQATEVGGTD